MKLKICITLAILLALFVAPVMSAVNVCTVNYIGECNSAYITISSGTITIDLDDIKEFNVSVRGYSTATLNITATEFRITRDGNATNTTWDISNPSYDTVRELLNAVKARSDITIEEYSNITDIMPCTALNDVSSQDVNGTTKYTTLATTQTQYTTTNYPTFGALETALEATSNLAVAWSSQIASQQKGILSTSTLDNQTKASIKTSPVTLTAGGTISDAHSPYYKITGTIDDVLFCLQLLQPDHWEVIYSDNSTLTIIGGL